MGLFDKFKSAVDTAADAINKTIELSQKINDPLADPMVKKYYEITYGLIKTIGQAGYDAIKKYIEYHLGEPCDETTLRKTLECYSYGSYTGCPLYDIIEVNPFGDNNKNKKLDEVNKVLNTLNLYRCAKEEAYDICFKKEIEEITSEFENVVNVVDKYGFKHLEEGMHRIYTNHYKNMGPEHYYNSIHMVVKKKFLEGNSAVETILVTCLDHAAYEYKKIDGPLRIASIVLRALNFEKHGDSEEGYTSFTKDECLDFVTNNEYYMDATKGRAEKNPFDTIDYNADFANQIIDIDIMSGKDIINPKISYRKKADRWMPDYKTEPYYTDKVCNLYWKHIIKDNYEENIINSDDAFDIVCKHIFSED
ncbi:MAG: hypothetical protein E7555_10145 [Ruminococcaceae bacterium]|nr:hypothetical protein [Oscillospiraceae bacterium]